jgi:hypothetical protein
MAVDTVLHALANVLDDYALVRDCIAGQSAVKLGKEKYLPVPDPLDASEEGKARYLSYIERATFYGATGRTLRGLVGLVFDKDPAVEAPELLAPVIADASGGGMSLDASAEASLFEVVGIGRAGLLTDYPVTEGPTTRADALAGNIRPTIIRIPAENVINWRTRTVGAKTLLSLVVIREAYVVEDDGFAEQTETQHRVLRLTPEGNYTVSIYRDGASEPIVTTPTDGKGLPLREIPFTFIGAENNDPSVDRPPLLDIAQTNIAHYRNSADYEESVFMLGQPTPVFAGLTKAWVDEVFHSVTDDGHGVIRRESLVRLGARGAIPLPVGGSAELLQVQPNTLAFEAMTHKEKQMIALGAKLIENSGTQQTATEATLDSVLDNSVLATCARNVSKAYKQALAWAWLFMTGDMVDDPKVLDYSLATDFGGKLLTAADRSEIVGAWTKNAITWEEMRWGLKRAGTAFVDDDQAKEDIAQQREEGIDFEAKAAEALTSAAGGLDPAAAGAE